MTDTIQHTSNEDEGWYTKRPCSKCGKPVLLGALWTLLNLDQPVLCKDCERSKQDDHTSD